MFTFALLIVLPALALCADIQKLEDDLFNGLDGNKDGKITEAETESFFLGFDTNKDGEITEAELAAAIDKIDPGFAGKEKQLYGLFDRNNDNEVNKADIDAVFTLTDANNDNQVTRAEYKTVFDLVLGQITV